MTVPVNVSIPAFNSSKFIIDALNSISKQSVKVECINVCDDFSEDDTCNIVEKWSKNHPEIELNIIRNEKNLGYGGNLDVCLSNCSSQYLQILHADDVLKETAISNNYNKFLQHPELALVGGQEEYVDRDLKIVNSGKSGHEMFFNKGEIYEFVSETAHYIPVSSVMLNTEKAKEVGKFNLNNLSYDEFFWLRTLFKYPILIHGTVQISRRLHGENLMHKWFFHRKDDFLNAIKFFIVETPKLEKRENKRLLLIKYQKKRYVRLLLGCAGSVIKKFRNSAKAFFYLKEACKLSPLGAISNWSFWKITILVLLNTTHLYDLFFKLKQKKG